MKLLVLGGVDNAGKSATVRYSTKYLRISDDLVCKFLTQRNPPKSVSIKTAPVYIYCTSPQEIARNNIQKCRAVFKRRIQRREANALIIMPFNLENKYQQAIEGCLDELVGMNMKNCTSFVFLNADLNHTRTANNEAWPRVQELRRQGYRIIGEVSRTLGTTKDEQGKNFSVYVKQQITP